MKGGGGRKLKGEEGRERGVESKFLARKLCLCKYVIEYVIFQPLYTSLIVSKYLHVNKLICKVGNSLK